MCVQVREGRGRVNLDRHFSTHLHSKFYSQLAISDGRFSFPLFQVFETKTSPKLSKTIIVSLKITVFNRETLKTLKFSILSEESTEKNGGIRVESSNESSEEEVEVLSLKNLKSGETHRHTDTHTHTDTDTQTRIHTDT